MDFFFKVPCCLGNLVEFNKMKTETMFFSFWKKKKVYFNWKESDFHHEILKPWLVQLQTNKIQELFMDQIKFSAPKFK